MAAAPELAWKATDRSLALTEDDRTVWQFHYAREGKPYLHPLTLGGHTLTDQRPADHPWHHGLWFSWKTINGMLYWEEDPKTGKSPGETEITDVQATRGPDHSARFELSLGYHPPGKPPVLLEKRKVTFGPPAPDGRYLIDWSSTFMAQETDVVLDRTPIPGEPKGVGFGGYAGLSLRLAPALRKWQFADEEGPVRASGKKARWMSFAGPLQDGRSAAIVVLDHPRNPRHPTPWYLAPGMPYFSPAFLYLGSYTLPARQSLSLKYRILIQPGPVDRDALDRQWRQFAEVRAE